MYKLFEEIAPRYAERDRWVHADPEAGPAAVGLDRDGAAGARLSGPVSRLLSGVRRGRFAGWARQPGKRTVQSEVERALGVSAAGPVALTVAGRTDAGVHALGQVASYEGPTVSVRSLNALLPEDVSVLSCVAASEGFDARRDATSGRTAIGCLSGRLGARSTRARAVVAAASGPGGFAACAAAVVGTHDFTAFTPTETEHVRFSREVFGCAYWRASRRRALEFWIEADAFMRHMNRVLVGTMLEVGGGRRSSDSFWRCWRAPRSAAGRTAPAHGLYLVGVGYGGERVLSV